jgi:hypothetical protein
MYMLSRLNSCRGGEHFFFASGLAGGAATGIGLLARLRLYWA